MGLTATKYKETEVGLIPEDWDLVPLNKVFTFHSTSNYSKAQMVKSTLEVLTAALNDN